MSTHTNRLGRAAGLALAACTLAAAPAHAHGFGAHDAGLAGGLVHPFLGLDHLLAIVAVGLLASQAGGGRVIRAPAAFAAATAGGFALATAGTVLPFLEPALLASVLGIGALVAAGSAASPPVLAAVAAFGALHGMAHGAELAGSALMAGIGMAAATGLLLAAGLGTGLALARVRGGTLVRISGGAVAAAGVMMALLA